MFIYEVKIPHERIAILIGKKGEVKRKLQRLMNVKLKIDSQEGAVRVEGEDSIKAYITKKIVKAIGRGFNPKVAFLLSNEEYEFELIEIKEFSGKSKKTMHRVKARLIGSEGKAWKMIERLTGCQLSVYGKTVGIIGPVDLVDLTRHAVEHLLEGSPHGNVYKFIQDEKKKAKLNLR